MNPQLAGLGVRVQHYATILKRGLRADCAEVVTENFMNRGGRPQAVLEALRQEMPIFLHGVGLSLGSVDPFPHEYLRGLRQLVKQVEPQVVSDHLCFGSIDGHRAYDLWPLPFTDESARHIAQRISEVQDFLGRRIAVENVSSYVNYRVSCKTEWDFMNEVLERADCLCLLDVNNVYVSANNHGFAATEYLAAIPGERVAYYHLAGHSDHGSHLLDDHGSPPPPPVWELYQEALAQIGPRPTIIEWDSNLPELEMLEEQANLVRERLLSASTHKENMLDPDTTSLRRESSPSPEAAFK